MQHHVLPIKKREDMRIPTRLALGAALLTCLLAPAECGKMVSVFNGESEEDYDRYAAALAAMEPLRAEMMDKVQKSSPLGRFWYYTTVKRGNVCDLGFDPKGKNRVRRRACADYVLGSARAIEAMDLTVEKFNSLSKLIAADKQLRKRIYQQAYLYRVGAELDGEKVPMVQPVQDHLKTPQKKVKKVQLKEPQVVLAAEPKVSKRELQELRCRKFAKVLRSIEKDRNARLDSLARDLKLPGKSSLPSGICDEPFSKVADSKVRKACGSFSDAALHIAAEEGFAPEEFNAMLGKLKTNGFFRSRVNAYLRKAA